jgi:4-amino-4-deoxy-L-arabinose transferase-like glycosyltransferase
MDHPTLPSNGLSNHLELAGLALVLALAAVLRLGWPGVNSFGYDEARVSQLALQMARDGSIPVAQPTGLCMAHVHSFRSFA